MADYVPLETPGNTITRPASAAISGGMLCMVSGSGTIAKTSGAVTSWVGVAGFDAASGDQVTLYCGGTQRLVASGGITAGDQVVAAANGAVSSLAAAATAVAGDINSARQVVGLALTTATNGNLAEIRLAR